MFLLLSAFFSAFAADPQVSKGVEMAMLARDFGGCQAVWDLGAPDDVRGALLEATTLASPPWAPMRAAECVIQHAPTDPLAAEAAKRWVQDPATPGFALLVVQGLDRMPEPVAVELADLAVARAGTDARFARYAPRPLRASVHPAVRERAARIPAATP